MVLVLEQQLKLQLKLGLAIQHRLDKDSKHWDSFLGLLDNQDRLIPVYQVQVLDLPVVLVVVASLALVPLVGFQVLKLVMALLVYHLPVVGLLVWLQGLLDLQV